MIGGENLQTCVIDRALRHRANDFAIELDGSQVGGDLDAAELAGLRKAHLMGNPDPSHGCIEDIDSRSAHGAANRLGEIDPGISTAIGAVHYGRDDTVYQN